MIIGIRCDAGRQRGVGHLVRCVALAEELVARGVKVKFLSDLGDLPWAISQLQQRSLPVYPPPADAAALVAAADQLKLDALVIDSYTLDPTHSVAVRATGRPVLAIVDGELRGQSADIYVDQNLDATITTDGVGLAGLGYALLRSSVRQLRPATAPENLHSGTPKVVAFFGGTDAYRAAPTIAELLAHTKVACEATIVAADDSLRRELLTVKPEARQRFEFIAPTDELPKILAGSDLVISASGTSTWELLCLGLPAALVWVVDNQIQGYERTVAHGYAAGLGRLGDLNDTAVDQLRNLLTSPTARAALATRAWSAVDGRGVERVATALLSRLPQA